MNSPRSGFRRAAIASWALAGLGAAGVAGTSALAYSDTLKPVAAEVPAGIETAVIPAPAAGTVAAPPTKEAPSEAPAPAYTAPPPPQYTRTYPPAPEQTSAPAPVQQTYTQVQQTDAPAPAFTAPAQGGPVGGRSNSIGSSSVTKPRTGSSGSSSSTKPRVSMGGGSGPNKFVPHTVAKGS